MESGAQHQLQCVRVKNDWMCNNVYVECVPVPIVITCSDLPSLTNGMIMYSAGSPDNRPFSSSAVYSCNTGYTLTGGTTTRVCVSGGRWDGSPQTCQGEFCNSCNTHVNQMKVVWITSSCTSKHSYLEDLTPPYTVTIGPTDPPPRTTCPDLSSLINGMIMYSAGSPGNRPFSSSATYSCSNGYTLTGSTTRTCVSGGSWSGSAPTCKGEVMTCTCLLSVLTPVQWHPVLTYPLWPTGWSSTVLVDPPTTDQWAVQLLTLVTMATVWSERQWGLVGVRIPGVGQLQCASVSGVNFVLFIWNVCSLFQELVLIYHH